MPYTKQNLPDWLKDAPEGVVAVFVAAFNNAWEDYAGDDDREAISQRIARAAIKKAGWTQDENGQWREKAGEAAPTIRYTGDVLRESAFKETVPFDAPDFQILEAEADGFKRIVAPLLRVGFSKNSAMVESRRGKAYPRYYSRSEVEGAVGVAEGMTIYIGFDEHNDKVDVAKELGVYEGARFEGGMVRGAVKVYADQNWVVDRLRANPRSFGGLSIEGTCDKHALATVDGREAAVVEGLKIQCARLVKNPAAAGPIEGLRESDEGGEPMENLTLQQLKESFRNVYEAARAEFITEADVKAKDAKIVELTETIKTKDKDLETANTKLHEAESYALVEAAMPRTKDGAGNEVHAFPERVRAKLHESLKGQTDKAVIEAAVKEMAEILSEATGAGKPVGAGMSARATSENTALAEAQRASDELCGVVEKPEAAPAVK